MPSVRPGGGDFALPVDDVGRGGRIQLLIWQGWRQLERELLTNPFLRADDEDMRNRWGGTSAPETFAKLRAAKDDFR